MSDEDINNSNNSSPTDRGYSSLESCNSNDLSSNTSDFDNYVEMHQETISTQQLILSSDTDDGLEEHLNIGNLHILENSDTFEAAGDCAMVAEARGIRQENNNPPQFPIPSQVPSESSGYLGSNESSVDSTTDRDDESMLGIHRRRITLPLPVRNCSSISSSVTESSIHSEDNVDIHRYMRSIIESAVQNSINKATKPEQKRKKLTKHINQASGSNPDSSESDDSFFSSEKLSSNFSSDNSHLYKMTMSIRYPDELILTKSKSLDSFIHKPCKTQHYLRKEFVNGDNVYSGIDQPQFLKDEIKKFFKKDMEDDSRNLLSNLNALYPRSIQSVNFDAYVNTTNCTSANCNSDKLSRASRNKDNEEKDSAANNYQTVDVKKITPHVQNEDTHFEAFETLQWDILNTCDPSIIDQLSNLYDLPSDSKLIRKPPVSDDIFPGNGNNEVSDSVDYILAKHIRDSVALQENMADQGSKNSGLKYRNNSSYMEKNDMSSLFYVGETKGYSTESDEYDKSESGKEDDLYKHDATLGDENNNYVLSQTSSDDSFECETSSKFQFTKDISQREECLRQSAVAVDFEHDDKFKNNDDTPKRRVSFNNDYPKHIPNLHSYFTNRHDFSMQNDLGNYPSISTMDAASSTDFLSSTDEEFVKIRMELAGQVKVINDAQKGSFQLLCDLQGLWMNVSDVQSGSCSLPNTNSGEHTLLQQIHLCSFITDQMHQDWRTFMSANPIDMKKLHKLQHANKFLKEQLDSCRIIQSCLESEINYAAKEKALLNDEVKHLSYKLATKACKLERASPFAPVSPTTEVYYQRTSILKNQEDVQVGIVSPHPIPKNNGNIALPPVTLNDSNNASVITPDQELEQAERNFVKQREDDFESIMDCVRDRKCVMDTLNSQLDQYQEDVQALQQQIETTNLDKEHVLSSYETLIEEKKVLIQERDKYESWLKTLLKDKSNSELSLQDILQNLMAKLNLMTNDKQEKTSRCSLMESAMQTVQNQNLTYREEIIQLKEKLAFDADHSLCLKLELEDSLHIANNSIEELKKIITHKDEIQRSQEERLSTLEDLQNAVTHVKSDLDNAVAEKDDEIIKLKKNLEEIHALNIKQQRKIHDLQKVNSKLARETKEHRRSIEQLGTIINQLRHSISNQKAQYTERVESASEEVVQSKEHCRWLQLQVDHLNVQLADAHERIKVHEKDKTALAQQVLSAEEERKVVDRKLNELKSALQSDTVLRQALIERNEALQTEIHRLRRAKLASISSVSERMPNVEGEFANPPSDFSTTEGLSSLNSFPLAEHKHMPIGERRKNRYPASAYRKATDSTTPRIAVSLHNATGLNCNESTHLDVDLNAGGATAAAKCSTNE